MIGQIMIPFIMAALAIVSFLLAGLLLDFYIIEKRRRLLINIPKFFGLGIGSIAVFQLLSSLWGVELRQPFVFAIFLTSGLPLIFDKKLVFEINKNIYKRNSSKHIYIILLSLLGLFGFLLALQVFSHTIWGSDAYAFWLAKASAFFQDGRVNRENIFIYYPFDHPLLWPLTAAWVYHFIGKADEYYLQIFPLAILLSMIVLFFQANRGISIGKRLAWTGIFALTPFFLSNAVSAEYAGNADLLVSFFFLLAVVFLFNKNYIYAVLFLFFSLLTKNDAVPSVLGFLVFYPYIFKKQIKKGKIFKPWLVLLALFLTNIFWKNHYDLSNRYLDFSNTIGRPIISYMWYTANAFREEFRQISYWGAGWWLIFLSIAMNFTKILKKPTVLLCFILMAFQFLGYFAVYYLTPEDQASHIASSIFRLVLQVFPSFLFLASQISYNKTNVNRN